MLRRFILTVATALSLLLLPGPAAGDDLEVTFIDVGQGAAVLLDAEDATVLVDAGQWDDAHDYLRRHGINELDLVVASHAHADHIGGFPPIFEEKTVREIWYNGQEHTTQTFEQFLDAALESGARYREPTRTTSRSFGALEIEVLHPDTRAEDYDGHHHDKNIVVRAEYEDFAAILPGDAERNVERELVQAGVDLNADVLKMGHHGSRTSTGSSFAQTVDPNVAVYQASEGNQYGHPHDEALSNAQDAGATIYGTDRHGTIQVTTDGTEHEVITEDTAPTRGPPASEPGTPAARDCVDVNTASHNRLQEIIHIGPARADQILELRPFAAISSLDRIDGIGPARLDDIREQSVACTR